MAVCRANQQCAEMRPAVHASMTAVIGLTFMPGHASMVCVQSQPNHQDNYAPVPPDQKCEVPSTGKPNSNLLAKGCEHMPAHTPFSQHHKCKSPGVQRLHSNHP
jgi:hypothetical protein